MATFSVICRELDRPTCYLPTIGRWIHRIFEFQEPGGLRGWHGAYLFGTLRKDSPLHDYWKLLRERNTDLSHTPLLDQI
jgi:hypothetical protein